MERISIFNYEAFYLDFLEGNLSENDCVLLFDFLEKHPELKVDLDELPLLNQPLKTAPTSNWNNLKKVDLELEAISMNTIEPFLIADLENQLSSKKQVELTSFLTLNKEARQLKKEYEQTILVADKSIVYPNHSELKHQRRIALWPMIAIAASILVFFGVAQFMQTDASLNNESRTAIIAAKSKGLTMKINDVALDNNQSNNHQEQKGHPFIVEQNTSSEEMAIIPKENKKKPEYNEKIEKLPSINKQDPETFINDKTPIQEEPQIAYHPVEPMIKTVGKNKNDNATVAYAEMENPIKPITKRISELTKTEVDYKTTKKTSADEKRGFYLKIGSLEIDRPKRK